MEADLTGSELRRCYLQLKHEKESFEEHQALLEGEWLAAAESEEKAKRQLAEVKAELKAVKRTTADSEVYGAEVDEIRDEVDRLRKELQLSTRQLAAYAVAEEAKVSDTEAKIVQESNGNRASAVADEVSESRAALDMAIEAAESAAAAAADAQYQVSLQDLELRQLRDLLEEEKERKRANRRSVFSDFSASSQARGSAGDSTNHLLCNEDGESLAAELDAAIAVAAVTSQPPTDIPARVEPPERISRRRARIMELRSNRAVRAGLLATKEDCRADLSVQVASSVTEGPGVHLANSQLAEKARRDAEELAGLLEAQRLDAEYAVVLRRREADEAEGLLAALRAQHDWDEAERLRRKQLEEDERYGLLEAMRLQQEIEAKPTGRASLDEEHESFLLAQRLQESDDVERSRRVQLDEDERAGLAEAIRLQRQLETDTVHPAMSTNANDLLGNVVNDESGGPGSRSEGGEYDAAFDDVIRAELAHRSRELSEAGITPVTTLPSAASPSGNTATLSRESIQPLPDEAPPPFVNAIDAERALAEAERAWENEKARHKRLQTASRSPTLTPF